MVFWRVKVLSVIYDNRVPNNDRLYDELGRWVERLDVRRVDRTSALNLHKVITPSDIGEFDRIVIEIRAKHALAQRRFLRTLSQLVLFEEDTWQNYAPFSKNEGFFELYYRAVQPKRIIHSGYEVALRTRALGFDSVFLPKGYDGHALRNLNGERDIEFGFVGRVTHANYASRKRILDQMSERSGLQILRTHSTREYLETLNRIRVFVSPDVGFGEHMIKNFEAMACGCLLVACRQGEDDAQLGFEHMHNVCLFSDVDDCMKLLARLQDCPEDIQQIAERGQQLVEAGNEHAVLAKRFAELLSAPLDDRCHAPLPSPTAYLSHRLRRLAR